MRVADPVFFLSNSRFRFLIAGSCATKIHELRQVRKGATVVTLFVCHRVPGYHFFVKSLFFFSLSGLTATVLE